MAEVSKEKAEGSGCGGGETIVASKLASTGPRGLNETASPEWLGLGEDGVANERREEMASMGVCAFGAGTGSVGVCVRDGRLAEGARRSRGFCEKPAIRLGMRRVCEVCEA